MEALHELVKEGKVRALGASAMYGYQFYNMQVAARNHGWTPFSAMENHYNLLYREDERELIPICKQMNVSLMHIASCSRTSGKTAMEVRFSSWNHGSGCYGKI